MRKHKLHKLLLFLAGLGCLGLLLLPSKPAQAATPTTINFQGKVVNNTAGNVGINVSDTSYTVIFRLYNSASPTIGGSCTTGGCLWEETDSVTTVNGVFQVELGNASGCSFFTPASCNNSTAVDFSSDSLYLTMKFNGDAAGFMTPLIHFTGVPYAYSAGNSAALGGLAAGNFVQLAQGLQTDSSTTNVSIFVNKTNASGSPNILQLQKSGKDVLLVNNSGSLLLGQAGTGGLNGSLIFNTTNASSTNISIVSSSSTAASYSIILPTAAATADNYCLTMSNHSTGATSFMPCGAGSTRTVTLTPEFAGAVMTGDGTSNTGTMTSDFCSNTVGSLPAITTGCNSGQTHNFYQWTANATNDYEIFVKWQAPSDFASFSAVNFNGFRTSTSDAVTMTLYNAAGTSCGSASIAGTVNTWNNNTAVTTSCTPSPGEVLTIDVHLSVGVNSEFARIGEITLTYNRN
jgi:hypothetical protein